MPKNTIKLFGSFLILLLFLSAYPLKAEILVQVMSVQDQAAAQKEADRLFNLGIPSFSRAEEVPDLGQWNRVYLGPFDTESDARAAADTLKKQGTIKDFVIKTGGAALAGNDAPRTGAPEAADPEAAAVITRSDGTIIIGEDPAAARPETASAPQLPIAETPTYGEPVSPEQARQLDLDGAGGVKPVEQATVPTPYGSGEPAPATAGGGQLPTYGEAERMESRKDGPAEFKAGDDMPGLVPAPAPSSSEAAAPGGSSAAPAPAPSAGEGDAPIMLAQAGRFGGSSGNYAVQKLDGFTILVDLSSSMKRMSNCDGKIKEEAVATLLRKMNRRIPSHPYNASLRVFGYKNAITKRDFTTLYYGPSTYDREAYEDALARLVAANSVSPFATAIDSADSELQAMGNPKAVLMFADFEESIGSGNSVQSAARVKRRYGSDLSIYTFYITRQLSAVRLARDIASTGGGNAFDICLMLNDESAFEDMMLEIFGPGDGGPCPDQDGDGVCDNDDLCPNTPRGAPVDERGCWIAAYSQFFDFDKAVVKNAFLPRIKHAAEIMVKNPDLPLVVIAGHTDNIGRPEYNLELGRRRAKAVFDLMAQYGVPASRMSVESYGDTRPVATNDSEEGRARNRRVEFHIGEVPPHRGN